MKNSLPYERIVLPNGVRLLLIDVPGVNSVATCVMVGVGSRYETKAINGVSHFLEHMVFKGTKKYPTTEDVNTIERQGGLQNAYTDIDITNYHNKVLSTDWSLALEINKELALKPLLEEKYIEKERNVILEEMKRYEDEPAAKVEETFHTMMYPGTKLGMRIIGEEDSLNAANAQTLRSYHDAWYRQERMVVVVAGQLKTQNSKLKSTSQNSKVKEKVQEWFGERSLSSSGLTRGSRSIQKLDSGSEAGMTDPNKDGLETVQDHQDRPHLQVVTKPDAQQAHLVIGLRTFSRASEDRFAWNVFNLLMGISFTSRLFKEIREKRGLCYHIRSSSNNWADVGNWSIYAGVGTAQVPEATRAILAELTKAVEKGIGEDEIAVSKKRLKTILSFKSEDPEFFTEYYGRQELFGEPLMTLDDYIKKIESVTKADIDALLKKYFVTSNLNMALVWNKKRDEKLGQLLHL